MCPRVLFSKFLKRDQVPQCAMGTGGVLGDFGGTRGTRGKLKGQSEGGCRTATSVDLSVDGVACLVF